MLSLNTTAQRHYSGLQGCNPTEKMHYSSWPWSRTHPSPYELIMKRFDHCPCGMARTTRIFPGWTGYFPREISGEFEGKILLAHSSSSLARRRWRRSALLDRASLRLLPPTSGDCGRGCRPPGAPGRNSDSTSTYYYEIRELKKTFKFNSGNLNYLPEVSFQEKKKWPQTR